MMGTDPLLAYLRSKSLLILGFGREGKSSLRFLMKHWAELGLTRLGIADRSDVDLIAYETEFLASGIKPEIHSGDSYLDAIGDYDLVLKSPGISLKAYTDKWLRPGYLACWPNTEISGQIDLFLRFAPMPATIGITGTKGKSTTSSLLACILEHSGRSTYLAGNIGVPILDNWDRYREDDHVVVELSSHQLQFVQASPHYAAITNFYPEHLDHYNSYDEYLASKLNILRYQTSTDCFVLNTDDQDLCHRAEGLIRGRTVRVGMVDGLPYRGLNPHLMGDHHALDVALAVSICRELGLDLPAIRAGIEAFPGIPHRCEYVGTYSGIRFYNDSIATIPQATLFAIDTLKDVDVLIVGGMDRGLDYTDFVMRLTDLDLLHVVCLPETGTAIYEALNQEAPGLAIQVDRLTEAVLLGYRLTRPGRSCLLSPAASSYHRWKSFEERGDEFKSLVRSYSE